MMISKQYTRNGSIDFWKFIFSVLILLYHSRSFAQAKESLFIGGAIGVEFFFIVSGVFLASSEESSKETQTSLGQDTFQFMKKKILSFMPDIYIAWGIAFVVEHLNKFSFHDIIRDGITSIWELLFLTEAGFTGYISNRVTWYISAMLLAMLFIFPLMRKYGETFYYIIAPLTLIFLMGITCHIWNSYREPHAWLGYTYKSIIRAVMGLVMGCLCYKFGKKLRQMDYTHLGKILFTLFEWLGYGIVIIWSFNHGGSKADWILALILAMSVIISYTQVSLTDYFFSKYIVFNKLGKFSFYIYLGHRCWSLEIKQFFPELNYYQRLPIYIGISIITALFIMFVSIRLKKWWLKSRYKCKNLIIKMDRKES